MPTFHLASKILIRQIIAIKKDKIHKTCHFSRTLNYIEYYQNKFLKDAYTVTHNLSKQDITTNCRLLGVHVTATKAELKQTRDRLAKLYHPDKNIGLSKEAEVMIKNKFQLIQNAYEFLSKNHSEIQELFKHLNEFSLTHKGHVNNRSHWVYTAVESYSN